MRLITIDFETFWDKGYTLKTIPATEYVDDPRYETISCATKVGTQPTVVTFGHDETQALFDSLDWSRSVAVGHNMSEFDALILARKFGIKPGMWACTQAMARPIHARTIGISLRVLAEHYGLRQKGSLEETNTKGKHLSDFSPDERAAMAEYNRLDTEITYDLFRSLMKETSKSEMRLIDMHIRMLVEPQFECDTNLLQRGLVAERQRLKTAVDACAGMLDVSPDELRKICGSSAKTKAALESLGVIVPLKTSPTTGKSIPALAKSDAGMRELCEYPDPTVQTLARTRLDIKSTILETRIERMIRAARAFNGMMPIPLRYYGAETTGRSSGIMKLNMQNLPRRSKDKRAISDVLRLSLKAPEGKVVVVADQSGIELRVNHTLWGVPSSIDAYKADPRADLYRLFASKLYDVPMDEVTSQQRMMAKMAQLGLGYGVGATTFRSSAAAFGGRTDISIDEANEIVQVWRATYPEITEGWDRCNQAIAHMASGDGGMMPIDDNGILFATPHGILTPRGVIRYPDLRPEGSTKYGRDQYVYGTGRNKARLYGAKMVENIVQHLARNSLCDAILEFAGTRLGRKYPLAHQVHDEVIYVVDEDDGEDVLDEVQDILRTPPEWMPNLIPWSEGSVASRYGLAK